MLSLPARASKKSAPASSATALADALDPPMGAVSPQGESEQKPKQEHEARAEQEQNWLPTAMEIAQREADEAAGERDPRDRVWGAPDWLTAQARALATAKPKKPKAAYRRRWR